MRYRYSHWIPSTSKYHQVPTIRVHVHLYRVKDLAQTICETPLTRRHATAMNEMLVIQTQIISSGGFLSHWEPQKLWSLPLKWLNDDFWGEPPIIRNHHSNDHWCKLMTLTTLGIGCLAEEEPNGIGSIYGLHDSNVQPHLRDIIWVSPEKFVPKWSLSPSKPIILEDDWGFSRPRFTPQRPAIALDTTCPLPSPSCLKGSTVCCQRDSCNPLISGEPKRWSTSSRSMKISWDACISSMNCMN